MSAASLLQGRRAGLILHPTSLPGEAGSGDLGAEAYHFVDFLVSAGASVWQMLPIGQPHADGSPYQCLSVHAGNRWMIGLEWLQNRGWLQTKEKLKNYPNSTAYRCAMLKNAWAGFQERAGAEDQAALDAFVEKENDWLADYALFVALKEEYHGLGWVDWPHGQSTRQPATLRSARLRLDAAIKQVFFEQYVFDRQWRDLKRYANDKGVLLFGDMPIFVAYDSVDVWAQRKYFKLNDAGQMLVVAGVPPDYFSKTGQRWGNPCYNWDALQADGFRWWKKRLQRHLDMFDLIRIDHFRGFEAYWEIPAHEPTAINGQWIKAPGEALFKAIAKNYQSLPVVAEDLGVITKEVEALRDDFGFPGMKIFQFGFDGDPKNPHLPHNYRQNCVAYSGTHDNDTALSWFQSLDELTAQRVMDYLAHSPEPMPWPVIRAVLASVANLAVIPMQDVMGLGGEHRMNQPGTTEGNWQWRFKWEQMKDDTAGKFRHLVHMYNRA